MSQINNRTVRRVYLVTYSRADLGKFPERSDFGAAVADAFNTGASKVKVFFYATCREKHEDGAEHYHCAVKLTGPKRWLGAKNHLVNTYGATVHFSDDHDSYYSAYRYICKTDTEVYHSEGHPNLKEAASPKTKHCIKANRNKRKSSADKPAAEQSHKPQRLTAYSVSKFLVEHNIKNKTALFAVAKEQQKDGKEDLINFCLNYKNIELLIENTWDLEAAPSKVQKELIPRMDTINNHALRDDCLADCNGHWLECAKQVLSQNNITSSQFGKAMRTLLVEGRGKHRNIMIVGPTGCGKTFLLKPLKLLFKAFCNPGNDKYAFMNAVESEVTIFAGQKK